MTASVQRGHLRLVHSVADVIPLPRTPMRYDPLVHHVLRLIPQEAITRRGRCVAVTGALASPAVLTGLSRARRDGFTEWNPYGDGDYIVRLTRAGQTALRAWDRTHPQRPSRGGGGDAA